MTPNILIPQIQEDERLARYLHGLYAQWRIDYEKAHPLPPIANVRFEHDPNWRSNWMSIQAVHDRANLGWQIAWAAFYAAQFAPFMVRWF